jgi:hypothetical protein
MMEEFNFAIFIMGLNKPRNIEADDDEILFIGLEELH